ncbi:MAG: ATP-binding protein, partial [Psychromonas sp.]
MAEQAYQLLRIIIIDSFWKGQVNELNLTGHTQLEGTNGAGKTSLMRLLPLFYGMRPSDIVSKVDQARNFADYYLPRDSSMLVYEYQRPYGQKCMVVASSGGRNVQFKFIDGAYNSEYFIGDNNKPYAVSDVDKFYRNAGCDRSVFLGVDKYRQVIQNLRSGRKVKDIYLLQKRYALSDQPCPHIDKVINGTIEKNLDFDAVKHMLVAIASDHLARNSIDEKEQISLKKEEISHWLADIQASRAIQKVADKISLWQQDFSSLESLLIKLQHLHFEVVNHISRLEKLQQERGQTKTENRQLLISLEKQLQESVEKLNTELFALKAKIKADQSHIDLLDEDKLNFEQDDAANYHLHAEQAPRIQNELNEVNAIIEAFEGNINKIQQKFDKLIQDRKLEHVTEVADNKNKTANIKEMATQQLSVIAEVYQQQRNDLQEQLNQQNLNLKMQQQNIESELKNAQFQLNQVIIEPELQSDIEQNQLLLSAAQENQNQHFQEQSRLQNALTQLDKTREKHSDKHKQENRYLEQLRSERAEIELQLIPETGSLHHFLNNEAKAGDWKQNIGRLLSSAQLGRCDLDPEWVGGELSFYGLQLDLQQIQSNDSLFLDETQLREKRDAIEKNYQNQVEKIGQLDEHLVQISKQIESQHLLIAQAAQALKQNDLNLQQLKVQHQNLAVKKQLAIKAHIDAVNEQIHLLENQQKANLKKQQEFSEQQQEQKNALNKQMLEKRMVVESDRDTQLTLLQEELLSLESGHNERIKDLKKQKSTDLDKLDPDGEVDKRAGERKVLIQALERCAAFEQKARNYKQFMNERYSQRDGLVERNQNRNIVKRNIEQSIEDTEVKLGEQISSTKHLIKKLNTQIHGTDDLLVLLNETHRDCEQSAIEAIFAEHQPANQADLSVSFCNDFLAQFKSIQKRLNEQLNKFNERFKKDHSTSELYENWQKLVADNDNYQGAQLLFKYRSPIADLLSSAEQKQKSTYQLVTV